MKNFDEIMLRALKAGPKRVAVAGQPDEALEKALYKVKQIGLAEGICFDTAAEAVAEVRENRADVLMKGSVATMEVMKAVLDKDKGLRTGHLMSHIAILEVKSRFILITDGGIVLNPTLEQKVEIIKNALPVARFLGIRKPRVGVLAAYEKVNPKMPETVDARKLSEMDIPGCEVQGPLGVDIAVNPQMAHLKHVDGPVAGHADILLVPSVLVGNIFSKGIICFSHTRWAGIVTGTTKPLVLLSRSDTTETRINNIALGVLISEDTKWVRKD